MWQSREGEGSEAFELLAGTVAKVEHGIDVVTGWRASTLWPGAYPLGNEPDMYYYLPATQFNMNRTGIFVRVRGDAADYADAVRRSLQREMPASRALGQRADSLIRGSVRQA